MWFKTPRVKIRHLLESETDKGGSEKGCEALESEGLGGAVHN